MYTVYIVPTLTDHGSQCRIVAARGEFNDARRSYKENPHLWYEIGAMNSRGELVCLEANPEVFAELKSCEPLMAGVSFKFSDLH